jgi:hypothetical protein
MSLAIHLQAFRNKDFDKFARSIVWDIFEPKAGWTREGWDLTYDGQYGGTLYLNDDELIGGFGIQRPSSHAIRDLYAVARTVPSAINLDAAFFVADAAFLADLPDWLAPALPKPPRVASSADQLLQYLGQG